MRMPDTLTYIFGLLFNLLDWLVGGNWFAYNPFTAEKATCGQNLLMIIRDHLKMDDLMDDMKKFARRKRAKEDHDRRLSIWIFGLECQVTTVDLVSRLTSRMIRSSPFQKILFSSGSARNSCAF